MKNTVALFFLCILILFLFSCKKEPKQPLNKPLIIQNDFYSENFLEAKTSNELEIININDFVNFSSLLKKMYQIAKTDKISGLEFNVNDTIFHITAYPEMGACYFRRNFIYVYNDSISGPFDDNKTSIKQLKTKLSNFINNPNAYKYNSENLKPAIVKIYIEDTQPMSVIKMVLKEFAICFNTLNTGNNHNFFKYYLVFDTTDWFHSQLIPTKN